MWVDFDRQGPIVSGGALAFGFPRYGPPKWRQKWHAFVRHLAVTPDDAAKNSMLDRFAHGKGVRTLGFINAHAMNRSVDDSVFAADLLALDYLVRDGIGVNTLYRMIGTEAGMNLNGTDLLPDLIARFAGRRIALFGTQADVAERAAELLRRLHGCEVITADGFQSDMFYLKRVADSRPALVVLGMGMPKQERVARLLKRCLNNDVAIVCGGAILDFLSGHKPRAPFWMRKLGLEWGFRLMIEPKRLFGRYVVGNPLFLLRSASFALRRRPAAPEERMRPERAATTAAFGIGGPIAAVAGQPVSLSDVRSAIALPTRRTATEPAVAAAIAATDEAPKKMLADSPSPAVKRSAVSVFSANRPVVARHDLFGREADLDRLLSWVLDQSGNALIYGPRGYGKTSLVRVFGEIADSRRHVVLYASCSREIGFDELMRGYLAEIPENGSASKGSAGGVDTGLMSVQQVAGRLAAVTDASVVVIIDEFDRIERADTRQSIIELVKDVSDLTASVRFVIVGVATDATAILGYHPSVHRCITCVPLTRLDSAAITDMLARKSRADGLVIEAREIETIVGLTAGSAYHAQLAGQKLVSNARRANVNLITAQDVDDVITEIVSDAMLMDGGFARLIRSLDDQRYAAVAALAKLALAGNDDIVRLALALADDGFDSDGLHALCLELVGNDTLRLADPQYPDGGLRFSNAFMPQLLLMAGHVTTPPAPGSP